MLIAFNSEDHPLSMRVAPNAFKEYKARYQEIGERMRYEVRKKFKDEIMYIDLYYVMPGDTWRAPLYSMSVWRKPGFRVNDFANRPKIHQQGY